MTPADKEVHQYLYDRMKQGFPTRQDMINHLAEELSDRKNEMLYTTTRNCLIDMPEYVLDKLYEDYIIAELNK